MSEMKIFAIRDTKADAFNTPFYMSTVGQALRAFGDEVNNPNSALSKHPEDYFLYELGIYEDATAAFNLLPAPRSLSSAVDFVSAPKAA